MARGESTKRSQLDAEHLTEVLRVAGAESLREEEEVLLILDGMELRKEHAQEQEALMQVKALDGKLVNGYRSINVLGLGREEGRGLLYHRLFSSQEKGFESEPRETQRAIRKSEAALSDYPGDKTWLMDRGFDDQAVWWTVWDYPHSHLVCRVYHFERLVEWQNEQGEWEQRYLAATFKHLKLLYQGETLLTIQLKGQKQARRQSVLVKLAAVPIRVRHPQDRSRFKTLYLLRVQVPGSVPDPWFLLTDWPVTTAEEARRIFHFYRRRWTVEDTFKFVKTCFGLEEVQVLRLDAIRTLVAFAWVAASFLFHLGLTLDTTEVQLLARLGGWEPRLDRPPGKTLLTAGLRRLLDRFATEAILRDHLSQFGSLPPFIQHLHDHFDLDP